MNLSVKSKRWLNFFLFIIAFFLLKPFCEKQTEGFTLLNISSSLTPDPQWEIPPLAEKEQQEIRSILSQKFHYLGAGGQCYAFASEDGTTVIKFFKFHMRKTYTSFLPYLPEFLKKEFIRKNEKAQRKLLRDFNSYKIAYAELKNETALLYIHLNKSSDLKQSVTLVDKLGIAHPVDLDSKEFIVQKRVELVYPYLQRLIDNKEIEKAKQAIDSLLQVNISRSKKGIFDDDARLHRNFGFFVQTSLSSDENLLGPQDNSIVQAIILDVGRFIKDPSRQNLQVYREDIYQITTRFKLWLQENYPELVPHLEKRLNEIENI